MSILNKQFYSFRHFKRQCHEIFCTLSLIEPIWDYNDPPKTIHQNCCVLRSLQVGNVRLCSVGYSKKLSFLWSTLVYHIHNLKSGKVYIYIIFLLDIPKERPAKLNCLLTKTPRSVILYTAESVCAVCWTPQSWFSSGFVSESEYDPQHPEHC